MHLAKSAKAVRCSCSAICNNQQVWEIKQLQETQRVSILQILLIYGVFISVLIFIPSVQYAFVDCCCTRWIHLDSQELFRYHYSFVVVFSPPLQVVLNKLCINRPCKLFEKVLSSQNNNKKKTVCLSTCTVHSNKSH